MSDEKNLTTEEATMNLVQGIVDLLNKEPNPNDIFQMSDEEKEELAEELGEDRSEEAQIAESNQLVEEIDRIYDKMTEAIIEGKDEDEEEPNEDLKYPRITVESAFRELYWYICGKDTNTHLPLDNAMAPENYYDIVDYMKDYMRAHFRLKMPRDREKCTHGSLQCITNFSEEMSAMISEPDHPARSMWCCINCGEIFLQDIYCDDACPLDFNISFLADNYMDSFKQIFEDNRKRAQITIPVRVVPDEVITSIFEVLDRYNKELQETLEVSNRAIASAIVTRCKDFVKEAIGEYNVNRIKQTYEEESTEEA